MPWIRPSDVVTYAAEGVVHFKLSDRLAHSDIILRIAAAYCSLQDPQDLFELIERDGVKYRLLGVTEQPITIDTRQIPTDFIEHFRTGRCVSSNVNCDYCGQVAHRAITRHISDAAVSTATAQAIQFVPKQLAQRLRRSSYVAGLP